MKVEKTVFISLRVKLLALALVPLVFAAYFAGIFLKGDYDEMKLLNELYANTAGVQAVSNLIDAVQRERGTSTLFLSGGVDRATLDSRRQETDALTVPAKASVQKTVFDAKTKETLIATVDGIPDLRQKVDAQGTSAVDVRKAFNETIKKLLGVGPAFARGNTSYGTGKIIAAVVLLEEAKEAAGRLRANLSSYAAADQPLTIDEVMVALDREAAMNVNLASPAMTLDAKSKEMLDKVAGHKARKTARAAIQTMMDKRLVGGYGVDGAAFFAEMTEYIDQLAGVVASATAGVESKIIGLQDSARRVFITTTVILLLMLGAVVAFMLMTIAGLMATVSGLGKSLKDIAQGEGDLSAHIDVRSNDELGQVAQYFNQFLESLRLIIQDIKTRAVATSTASDSLKDISQALSNGANDTNRLAESVAAAAEEMSVSMKNVADSMDQTSRNISMIATAAEEMTATVGEIAGNADRARVVSATSVDTVKKVALTMDQLGVSAREIDRVTETINEISAQTNMLALNATIEAARAGQAGKGFAVVANEIKELARQTAVASEDIRERVSGIQASTANAGADIGAVTSIISEVDGIMSGIAAAIEEQAAVTQDIARNIAQASQGVEGTNLNIAQSAEVTGSIAKDIHGVTHAIGEIVRSSDTLLVSAEDMASGAAEQEKIVSKFKL